MTQSALSKLTRLLLQQGLKIATAESCTAGLVAKLLTDEAGSSIWFERGFVTYSNESKVEMLEVSRQTLDQYGAVSRETVSEMAIGALKYSHADISLAISGIAGPDGGNEDKPVGTVWFAWATPEHAVEKVYYFDGDREAVRSQAAEYALEGMLRQLAS